MTPSGFVGQAGIKSKCETSSTKSLCGPMGKVDNISHTGDPLMSWPEFDSFSPHTLCAS